VKRSTLLLTGVLILVLSIVSLGFSEGSSAPTEPAPVPESSDELPPPPDEEGDEGFGVRCC
jgi:hypothetical protein